MRSPIGDPNWQVHMLEEVEGWPETEVKAFKIPKGMQTSRLELRLGDSVPLGQSVQWIGPAIELQQWVLRNGTLSSFGIPIADGGRPGGSWSISGHSDQGFAGNPVVYLFENEAVLAGVLVGGSKEHGLVYMHNLTELRKKEAGSRDGNGE